MTNKQRVFVERYLKCWNATEAAEYAGYRHPRQQGSRLLSNVDISAEIKRRIAEQAMSADEVLLRLADQARGDLADFWGVESIRDLVENDKSHIVKKIKTTRRKIKDDNEITTFEIELYDAQAALVHIGRHHGLFREVVDHTGRIEIEDVSDREIISESAKILEAARAREAEDAHSDSQVSVDPESPA